MIDIKSLKESMFDVVGAIYAVHDELGPGLNEYCYQEGLQIELTDRHISFGKEMSFHPSYHGKLMSVEYRVDFLCKDDIIVECKSVPEIIRDHRAQLFNYMRLLKKRCGILANFFPHRVEVERYFFDMESNQIVGIDGKPFFKFIR